LSLLTLPAERYNSRSKSLDGTILDILLSSWYLVSSR